MAAGNGMNDKLSYQIGGVTLRIDPETGNWEALEFGGLPVLNLGCETGLGFSFTVDGFHGAPKLIRHAREEVEGGARISLSYEFSDGSPDEFATRKYLATHSLTVTEKPDRIERVLRIRRLQTGDLTGPGVDRLRSAELRLGGVALGGVGATRVSCTMLRIVPGAPLEEMRARPRFFPSPLAPHKGQYDACMTAPDCAPCCVALDDAAGNHLSITPLPRRCAAQLRIFGQGDGVTVEHEFACSSWMDVTDEIEAGRQVIILQKAGWREAVPAVGRLMTDQFPAKTDPPAWTDNAVIYESEPTFDGGFLGLRSKLDTLSGLGVNAVYLMPWHRGGYATLDYYAPDPRYGTIDDLKATVRAAHERGMRFMFDLLSNIIQPGSPLLEEHPEFFYRDLRGRLRPHPSWANRCLDPASPGLRRYFLDYARWCAADLGADGFRVDAAAHRGANWNNLPGLQPHEHSHAAFTLLDEIRDAVRAANPEAILMAECFGPIQASISDMVCYSWMFWIDWMMECLADGRLSGSGLQRLMAEEIMAMPTGTKFTYYSHTHDSLAFLKRDVRAPLARAFFASLAFLGAGVMYFGGGWGMEARPEPDEADEYRRMFALRTEHNGFAGYATGFPESTDHDLFVYEKIGTSDRFTFITSFATEVRTVEAVGDVVFSRTTESSIAGGVVAVGPYDTVVLRSRT